MDTNNVGRFAQGVYFSALLGAAVLLGCGDDDNGGNSVGPNAPLGDLDQGKVVFASLGETGFDLFFLAAGGNPVNLTNTPGLDHRPVFSPDGSRIAFVSDRSGDLEIYAMDADGGNLQQLTDQPGTDDSPVWSPDGSRIAFVADNGTGDLNVFVMDADGTNRQQLTTAAGIDHRPVWSPDGQTLAFVSNRDSDADIFTVAAGGGAERRLTNNDAHDDWPAFSGDGSEIVFESNREGRSEIFKMGATGNNQTRLTVTNREITTGVFTARASKRPIFSPDNSRILFQGTLDDDVGELYTISNNLQGPQAPVRLTFNNLIEVDYLWAPDGTQVLYVAFAEGDSGHLFTLDLASASAVQILEQSASRPSWR